MLLAKQDSDDSPEEGRILLAFGVGFSYQLGLDEADSSSTVKKSVGGSGSDGRCRATGSSAEGRGGRGRFTARAAGGREDDEEGTSPSVKNEGPRICSSIQPLPKVVSLDRYLKKGDAPALAAAGANHSVLLTKEGRLFRWGVEDGDIYPFPAAICTQIPLPCVEVCCGRKHTMALMKGGYVMTWGTGYFGQLGHGDNVSYRHPRLLRRLDPQRLGERVIQVACGGYHSAVVTDAGRVFSWGFNRYGQCGNGSKDNTVPEPVLVNLSNVPPGRVGEAPKVVCGRHHSALVTSWGALYSWGACGFGKLGLQDQGKTVCTPREVNFFRDRPLLTAAAGNFHMVALSRAREVFSWGYGADGQGGHGSLLHLRTPRRVNSLRDVPVAQVVCGPWWSMAVTVDGFCYSWGCADGGWTGLNRPVGLSVVEPGASSDRVVETQSFDSSHNMHVPVLVESLAPYQVLHVGCGGGHSLVVAVRRARSTLRDTRCRSNNGETVGIAPTEADAPYATVRDKESGGSSGGGGGGDGGGVGSGAASRMREGGSTTSCSVSSVAPVSSSSTFSTPSTCSQPSGDNVIARPSRPPHEREAATAGTFGTTASRDLTSSTSESGWESGMVDEVAAAAANAAAAAAAAAVAATSTSGNRYTCRRNGDSGRGGCRRGCELANKAKAKESAVVGERSEKGGGAGSLGERAVASVPPQYQQPQSKPPESSPETAELPLTEASPTHPSFVALDGSRATENGDGGGIAVAAERGSCSSGSSVNGARSSPSSPTPCRSVPSPDERGQHPEVASPHVLGVAAEGFATATDATSEPRVVVPPAGMEGIDGRRRQDRGFSGGRQQRDVGGGIHIEGTIVGSREEKIRPGSSAGGEGGGSGQLGGGRERSNSPEYVAKVFSYCRHGRLDQVGREIGAGFDVCGQRDENGNTLLHCAAQNGLRSMCKAVLQDVGSRPLNLKNNRGNTALHYAYAFGFHQLGKYLAMNGADDTLVNDQGLTCYEGLDRHDFDSSL